MISVPNIARIVHEAQRAYEYTQNNWDTVAWDYLSREEQGKIVEAVSKRMQNPSDVLPTGTSQELTKDHILSAITAVFGGKS